MKKPRRQKVKGQNARINKEVCRTKKHPKLKNVNRKKKKNKRKIKQ